MAIEFQSERNSIRRISLKKLSGFRQNVDDLALAINGVRQSASQLRNNRAFCHAMILSCVCVQTRWGIRYKEARSCRHNDCMRVFLERFVLAVCAAAFLGLVILNAM